MFSFLFPLRPFLDFVRNYVIDHSRLAVNVFFIAVDGFLALFVVHFDKLESIAVAIQIYDERGLREGKSRLLNCDAVYGSAVRKERATIHPM